MQCPKCGSGVADDKDSCPICFADLNEVGRASGPTGLQAPAMAPIKEEEYFPPAGIPGIDNRPENKQPQPNYLSGGGGGMGGGGEVRVSLTGEVLEVATPTPRNLQSPSVGATGPRPPMGGPPPPGGSRGSYTRPVREEAGPKSSAGPVALILLLVIVLGGGGFGGWYWYNNRTNPKDQAVKAVDAVKGFKWKELYGLVAWSPETKMSSTSADDFEKQANKSIDQARSQGMGQLVDMQKQMLSSIKTTAGEPKIDGDKADVPLTHTIEFGGQSQSTQGTAKMIRQGGIWKLDMTSVKGDNYEEGFKAGQQLSAQLFGAPAGMGGMGGGGAGRNR